MNPSRDIFVAGVAGHNRGDDAIALCLRQLLFERYELNRVYWSVLESGVFSSGAPQGSALLGPLGMHKPVTEVFVNRRSPLTHARLAAAVARSSLVILGGGSIIQDDTRTSWIHGIMAYFAEVVFLARRFRKRLITAPIGVDPIKTETGRRMARYILQSCDQVIVRDARSVETATSLVSGSVPVTLAADPVFNLPRAPLSMPDSARDLLIAPAFEANSWKELPALLASIASQFLEQYPSSRCKLLAMDSRQEEDAGRIGQILTHLTATQRSRVDQCVPRTVEELLPTLHGAFGLVTMRLHPLIMAAGATPVLCLSRGAKTDAIAAELAVPSLSLHRQPWDEIRENAAAFLGRLGDLQAEVAETLAATQRTAARLEIFGQILDQYLVRKKRPE